MVDYNGVPIEMFFSRKGSNGKWRVFITTNTGLSFIKMIEIYQIRWTVEVFFKEAKQLLGLGKCQSNDFDLFSSLGHPGRFLQDFAHQLLLLSPLKWDDFPLIGLRDLDFNGIHGFGEFSHPCRA